MKLDDIERRLGEWVQQGMRKMADEILPRLQSVAMPFQREDDAEPGDACDVTCYVARDDGIFPEEGTVGEPLSPEEDCPQATSLPGGTLLAALSRVPELPVAPDDRTLVLCRERDAGRGEDSCLAVQADGRAFLGVFDGCGGSGAKTYAAFEGHTGAWVASRAATLAARQWFETGYAPGGDGGASLLESGIGVALAECRDLQPSRQLLMGSLSRDFPTTLAGFAVDNDGHADVYWCGDSRCYLLDGGGLHQLTADDAVVQDAMRALREDAPMTNVISASAPFVIHHRTLELKRPGLLIAATDGCFGYVPSPMAFEALLLKALRGAKDMDSWRRALDADIGAVSGDDYTLSAYSFGYADFKALRTALVKRQKRLEVKYPQAEADEAALFDQWEEYRASYERLLPNEKDTMREAEHDGD